jgi:hypothetical protein
MGCILNNLLFRKMGVAFLIAFGGVLVPAVLKILDDVHNGVPTSFSGAFWISIVAGAFGAGLRALLAISPINLVPSDAQHTLVGKRNPAAK